MEPRAIIAQQFSPAVCELLETAQHSIDIIVFDWRFYPTVQGNAVSLFNNTIFACAARGIKVRALVNNDAVKARLEIGGVNVRRLHSKKLLHTKMILVDNKKLVIGSHNFTQSAFTMNEEASVMLEMPSDENDFVKYFTALWGL